MARSTPKPDKHPGDKPFYPAMIVILAIASLFGLLIMPRVAPASGKLSDQVAPDFSLPVVANGVAGDRIKLSELRDKVVILDFWATWCGPCAVQAPILDRLAKRYPDDVIVLGINVGEAPARAKRYAEVKGLSYPILADPDADAQETYGANTLPTVVVIDKDGHIDTYVHGVVRESALERRLRTLRHRPRRHQDAAETNAQAPASQPHQGS